MLQHKGTIRLEAPGLVLRRFTQDDAQAMFENWASDENVTRFVMWNAHISVDETREILARWIPEYEKPTYYHWLIEAEGVPVGSVNFHAISDRNLQAEAGYCLGSRFWNQGIMTKALALAAGFLFETLGAEKLCALHDTKNPASGRVMEKIGMVQEGVLRRHMRRKDGQFCDLAFFGLLREEWFAQQGGDSTQG